MENDDLGLFERVIDRAIAKVPRTADGEIVYGSSRVAVGILLAIKAFASAAFEVIVENVEGKPS